MPAKTFLKSFLVFCLVIATAMLVDAFNFGWVSPLDIPRSIKVSVCLIFIFIAIIEIIWSEIISPMPRFSSRDKKDITEE